jgi:predicted Fe-Mo cluster-binding NifX family protein
MRVAFPSAGKGGLDAELSAHFGHCDAFTLVEMNEGEQGEVQVMPNAPHVQGGCMAPVQALKQAGVDVLVAGGMGARPLAGFQQVGIQVVFSEGAPTVQAALDLIKGGQARVFGPAQVCGGGEGHCGNH